MIQKKEESLQRLIDHLPVVVFEYTFFPDGHRDFTFISPRAEVLLGISPGVIMNGHLSISSFIHPTDLAFFNESINESVSQLKEWKWEGRCKGINGYLWIEAQGFPIKMDDGSVSYNGIFFDITEKKRLEQQQLETEQRYRDLIEQLPLGIVIHINGILVFVNAAAAKMVGGKQEDLIGMNAYAFAHPDSFAEIRERGEKVLHGESTPPIEQKYLRLDGSTIHVEASGHPYQYRGENAIQIIFSDITERKRAEASFKKTETLFYQLFQSTPLAVTLLNEEGNVVQINKGFEETFGFNVEELQGKSLNQFIVPSDLKEEGNDLNNLISSNQVVKMETIRHRKDKTLLSVIIYGVPVLLQDQTIGIFGMYVDITDTKKTEEELKIRNTELDNFVYKVSHDLRAPLSSILGLANLATLPGNDDNLVDYIKLMRQKVEQLDHFISDVLSHSKNLKMDLLVEQVDFQKIIDQTFSDLNYLKGADLVKKDIHVTSKEFYSDPWRVAEIFRNLISNAIKYRRLDHDQTHIVIDISMDDEYCKIVFKDNGIGIDKASLDRIFEMFYRASDQSEGSGLGLYIVRNAVEKLGGNVRVESELGKGTTFRILLPNQRINK
ncbi:MAG: PAS domain S-box protein [Cyclobacteriaceae bacterium]|nr:PAS domain S-box protein [Cyclobacteriaceae bacterium]